MPPISDSDTTPPPACPAWCERPAGHDWDDEWSHGSVRWHIRSQPLPGLGNRVELVEYENLLGLGRFS
jgi:hypothetical protein